MLNLTIERCICSKCGLREICSKQNEVQAYLDRVSDVVYDNQYIPLDINIKCKFFLKEVDYD